MFFEIALGRFLKQLAKVKGTGGSAFPGHVLERMDPAFISKALRQVRKGIVVIVGTNGKTTTSRLIAELLRAHGYKVFNNPTGSNWIRGVNSALLDYLSPTGKLDIDYAVIELDEGHSNRFISRVRPNWCVVLNAQRDQMDRFEEIDMITQLLRNVAKSCDRGVVLNHDDDRIVTIADDIETPVSYFRVADDLKPMFPSDNELLDSMLGIETEKVKDTHRSDDDVELVSVGRGTASFKYDGETFTTPVTLEGAYNQQNTAAAIAVVKRMIGDNLSHEAITKALTQVKPAFGRAESMIYKGQPLEITMVKNVAGFRAALSSFDAKGWATMTMNNDTYADSRDMSWIWDVDMSSLREGGVDMVAGVRAYEMALRLAYDEVPVRAVEEDIFKAFERFCDEHPDQPKRVYGSYTAILALRTQYLEAAAGLDPAGVGVVEWKY